MVPKDQGGEGGPILHLWWKSTMEAKASGADLNYAQSKPKLLPWQRANRGDTG